MAVDGVPCPLPRLNGRNTLLYGVGASRLFGISVSVAQALQQTLRKKQDMRLRALCKRGRVIESKCNCVV